LPKVSSYLDQNPLPHPLTFGSWVRGFGVKGPAASMARTGGAGRDSSSDASGRPATGDGAGKDGRMKGRAERPTAVQVDEAMDADSDGANRNETAEGGPEGDSQAMEEEEAGGENQDPSGADATGGETQPISAKDKRTVTSPAWDRPHLPGVQPAFWGSLNMY
jgi:hypothetical protein